MVRKKKRGFFDDILSSLFGDIDDFMSDNLMGGAAGYSIEVHTTPEGTEVRARVYGNVDKSALKRQLESMYPGAKVIIEGEEPSDEERQPLIRRIDEESKTKASTETEVTEKKVSITFREEKPVIERSSGNEIKVVKIEKVDEENTSGKQKVRIEFRNGRPIIKKIDG